MNGAHYHLLINHLPIVIPFVAFLTLGCGFITKSGIVKRAALIMFAASAVFAFAAAATGEGAAEAIENISGIEKKMIHAHENAADTFAIFSYLLGLVSLAGIWAGMKKKTFANGIAAAALILSIAVLFYASRAGTSGGEIRHTEIR